MALNEFIAEVWSPKVLVALEKEHVYASLANRDYQGEIANMGDTVRITGIGEITISSYTKDTDIAAPQALTDAQTALVITQAKYFNFALDSVDQRMAAAKDILDVAAERAAYDMADTIDNYVAGFYTDAPSTNSVGSSSSFTTPNYASMNTTTGMGTGTGVYDYIVTLGQYLTQSLVPKRGRWVVVPPWCTTFLALDLRFSGYNTPESRQVTIENKLDASGGALSDAYIGRIAGMDLYESNNAPNLGGTKGASGSQDVILAGHPMALAYAENLVKVVKYEPPYRFAEAIKGLHLYGAKTIRPQALATAFLQHP